MKPNEVVFKSESGKYRVLYCRDDLGKKYRVQMIDQWGHWKSIHWTDSPVDALITIMKRAAKED